MSDNSNTTVRPFLMFTGEATEAMEHYVAIFSNARLGEITRYGEGEPGAAGTVKQGVFHVHGQEIMCTDAPAKPDFTFTPAVSLFVSTTDEQEMDDYAEKLSAGGKFLMPPGDYGFSRKFAWLEDKYGVSWQINLV